MEICEVPRELELRKDREMPPDDVVVVCMDGADMIGRVKVVAGVLEVQGRNHSLADDGRSIILSRFVQECAKRRLPLNEAKSVVMDLNGLILGGELDGVRGALMHGRTKGQRFINRSLALLSLEEVPQVALQHWAGIFCFMASFRRVMFSVGQAIFPCISRYDQLEVDRACVDVDVYDEILVAALLAPLAQTNLRAEVRRTISMSDASEQGGAAAEATRLRASISQGRAQAAEEVQMNVLERELAPIADHGLCGACKLKVARAKLLRCPRDCELLFCSVSCVQKHRMGCRHSAVIIPAVVMPATAVLHQVRWELCKHGYEVRDIHEDADDDVVVNWVEFPGANSVTSTLCNLQGNNGRLRPNGQNRFKSRVAATGIREVMRALRLLERSVNGASGSLHCLHVHSFVVILGFCFLCLKKLNWDKAWGKRNS